ncbi:MAG: zinc-ribbon domain-containing protein [Lachnospiraceae bacterium]
MGIDELLQNIEHIEDEITECYTELGRQFYEKETGNAKQNFPEIAERITERKDKISEIRKQINLIKGIVICEHCGAEVKNTHTFCHECGHKMKTVHEDVPKGFVLCGNCNAVVSEDAKFCFCCGMKIGSEINHEPAVEEVKSIEEVADQTVEPVAEPAVELVDFEKVTEPEEEIPELTLAEETAATAEVMEEKNREKEAVAIPEAPVRKNIFAAFAKKEQETGRTCPQCGEPLNEDDTYCIACGAIFSVPKMETEF